MVTRMISKKLTQDAWNVEEVCERTANKPDKIYIYALAVAVLHILQWIERRER